MKSANQFLMRFKIATRIWAMLGVAFLAICFGTVVYLYEFKSRLAWERARRLAEQAR